MKILKTVLARFSRAKGEAADTFDLRLQSLSRPSTKRSPQRTPVLFRRALKNI